MIDRRKAYVKLSGVYFASKAGFPGYSDVNDLIRRQVRAVPDRMLLGNELAAFRVGSKTDDTQLVDQLEQ